MAPLAFAGLALGLATLSAGSPLRARQEDVVDTPTTTTGAIESSIATPIIEGTIQPSGVTDVEKWCNTVDLNNADSVVALWADEADNFPGGWANRRFPENWTEMLSNGGDNWVYNLTAEVDPTVGDAGIRGTIGAQCNPIISCENWVGKKGQPHAYWALRAVSGLQSKLDAAHAFLVDETIGSFLDIGSIAADFSAPQSDNSLEVFAAIISSALFVVGGVAGLVSVGASFAGAAAASSVGVATGLINQANARKQLAGKANAEKLLAASQAKAEAASKYGRGAGAMGGSTYLLGSTFGLISAATEPDNQVPAGLLEENLKTMFSDARDRLVEIGKLATGQGGDYSVLPHQEGYGGIIGPDAWIAGFFSNGRMLFGESNSVFQESLQTTFGTFRSKLVDVALQSAGFLVMSADHIDNSEDCAGSPYGGYGSQFIDFGDGNSRCMQMFREATSPDYEVLDQGMIDLIQGKYGFNMFEYYKAAYDCNKNGAEGGEPDLFALPAEEVLPTCFYNIRAQSVKISTTCPGNRCDKPKTSFELSDF